MQSDIFVSPEVLVANRSVVFACVCVPRPPRGVCVQPHPLEGGPHESYLQARVHILIPFINNRSQSVKNYTKCPSERERLDRRSSVARRPDDSRLRDVPRSCEVRRCLMWDVEASSRRALAEPRTRTAKTEGNSETANRRQNRKSPFIFSYGFKLAAFFNTRITLHSPHRLSF